MKFIVILLRKKVFDMTLKDLFKKRKKLYYKELLKYFRYIFNDHFTLVLFFLIGAGSYAYSNYLNNLKSGDFQAQLFIFILFFFISIRTSVKLIVEPADQVFLLAKEEEFYPIFKKEIIKSYLQSLMPLALLVFIAYPLLTLTLKTTTFEGFLLFLSLAALKWLNLVVKIYPYFYQRPRKYWQYRLLTLGLTLLTISLILFINIKIFSFFILFIALFFLYLFIKGKIYFNHFLKWDIIIEKEEARLNKLYRLIAVFVDVPQINSGVKRLNYLDPLIEKITKKYPKVPYYYSFRTVIRNTEYRSLILRLTLLVSFLLFLTNSYLISLGFMLFFLYILGFQLISIVKLNEKIPQFKIYPILERVKINSSLYLINQILIFMVIIVGIIGTINLSWIGLSLFPIGIVASYLFSYHYVPYRLKSNES